MSEAVGSHLFVVAVVGVLPGRRAGLDVSGCLDVLLARVAPAPHLGLPRLNLGRVRAHCHVSAVALNGADLDDCSLVVLPGNDGDEMWLDVEGGRRVGPRQSELEVSLAVGKALVEAEEISRLRLGWHPSRVNWGSFFKSFHLDGGHLLKLSRAQRHCVHLEFLIFCGMFEACIEPGAVLVFSLKSPHLHSIVTHLGLGWRRDHDLLGRAAGRLHSLDRLDAGGVDSRTRNDVPWLVHTEVLLRCLGLVGGCLGASWCVEGPGRLERWWGRAAANPVQNFGNPRKAPWERCRSVDVANHG